MKYIFRWYAIDQSKHHRRRYWVLLCINSSLIAIKWSCKDGIDWSTCDIHIKDSFLLTFNVLLSHKYLLKLCYRVVYIISTNSFLFNIVWFFIEGYSYDTISACPMSKVISIVRVSYTAIIDVVLFLFT